MRYIDVHCHLNYADYGDIGALICRLGALKVQKIITAGFDLPSSRLAMEFAEKYPQVYFTAGFHPTELKNYRESDLGEIAALARHPKCVAIGEIGLDYHYPDIDKPLQSAAFKAQIRLANSLGLPVQIHSRDSAADTLAVLESEREYIKDGALLHCYSYSPEIAAELEKRGIYFSFGGTSTYSGSKRARKSIAALPLGAILSETDSPYLAPASRRGQFPNTPESIPEIVENIAAVKGVTAEYAAENIWQNAHKLFKKLQS